MIGVGRQFIRTAISVGCVLAVVSSAWSQKDVTPRSPFMRPTPPPTSESPAVATPLDNLEFNGLVEIGGVISVSLRDKQTNANYWLSESEAAEDGLQIVRIDRGAEEGLESIVVRRGAATKELKMRDFNIITAAAPAKPAVTANTTDKAKRPAAVRANNSTIQSASDDEVRERMKRVAEEIRRRRAMRRAAAEQSRSNN